MNSKRSVAAIVGLGLLLRIVWAAIIPVIPVSDSNAYDVFARTLVSCGTYGWQCAQPSAFWPPGTSFLYAALYKVFGPGYLSIIALNLALYVATVWLTMALAEEWFGARVAALAGLLLAIWPSQIQFTTVLASELPFGLALLGGLFLWTRQRWSPWRSALAAGLVFGAASLIRPTALLIPGLLAAAEVARTRQLRPTLGRIVVVYAALFTVVAPWAARNARVFGRLVPVSTNSGSNLWMGNNDATTGGYADLPPEAMSMDNEAARDEYLGREAKRFIRQHPLRFARLTLRRLIVTHGSESIGVLWNEEGVVGRFGAGAVKPLKLVNAAYWGMVLLAALAGVGLLIRSAGVKAALLATPILVWAYFAAVHAVVVAQDRYHFPSIPFIAALAALTADRVWSLRDRAATSAASGVLAEQGRPTTP